MSDPKPDAKSISRRDFAVSAALATVAIATVSADLLAQEKPAAEAAKPEAPQPPKLSAASQAEVEERYTAILRKYGTRLSEDQKKDVHRNLVSQQQSLDQVRAYPLENWDEPVTVFNPVFTTTGGK
jgi:predicted component of type VI protein secretion system